MSKNEFERKLYALHHELAELSKIGDELQPKSRDPRFKSQLNLGDHIRQSMNHLQTAMVQLACLNQQNAQTNSAQEKPLSPTQAFDTVTDRLTCEEKIRIVTDKTYASWIRDEVNALNPIIIRNGCEFQFTTHEIQCFMRKRLTEQCIWQRITRNNPVGRNNPLTPKQSRR